jgi:SAM-dependent methyltransferase
MKARESGMPDEAYWNTFFDAECVVKRLFGTHGCQGDAVEFGCGYGTFTLPAARCTSGSVHAFDIEPDLVAGVCRKARAAAIHNIAGQARDFVAEGTGLPSQTQAHAMIYNLLHIESPHALLQEAWRVLQPGGRLSVIHWRSDLPTPRGPSLEIRPAPEQCQVWLTAAGFHRAQLVDLLACCPYHYGLVAEKPYAA